MRSFRYGIARIARFMHEDIQLIVVLFFFVCHRDLRSFRYASATPFFNFGGVEKGEAIFAIARITRFMHEDIQIIVVLFFLMSVIAI